VDWEKVQVKKERSFRSSFALSLLILMPVISFGLGVWQVKRLKWKTDLIAEYENRLVLSPLELPLQLDPEIAASMQYRRVVTKGKFRHDKEILVGPRLYEGEGGYHIITPLERENGTTLLINRGWIPTEMADQRKRSAEALPTGTVVVEGLIKSPANRNYFTPDNIPERGEYFWVDVPTFAKMTGAQPFVIEELQTELASDIFSSWELLASAGVPIGRLPRIDLRNNHIHYIITWFGLCIATSIMLVLLLRQPSTRNMKLKHARRHT
ncbi:SURF1 family-domain-containing protein, partial [Lipomyces oligophaga]|uniref:SURF1 family-domain-containing protein n=1 Tax=Lipomyces oligophaga TaxID=45792 RepID=UPI0034CF958B